MFYKGERRATKEVFEIEKLEPIKVEIREGLALMNGTSVMTGIGIVNVHNSRKVLDWSVKCSCAINEIVKAYDDHLSFELNNTKKHFGQQEIAKLMRDNLSDKILVRKREDHLYSGNNNEDVFKEKVQEYYFLRCVPQILGPVLDTINYTSQVLETKLTRQTIIQLLMLKTNTFIMVEIFMEITFH